MVRVTVLYPKQEGTHFDFDYYTDKHIPMLGEVAKPFGLERAEVDRAVSGADPNADAPYFALTHLYFRETDGFSLTLRAHRDKLLGDIRNFTDVQPQIVTSETHEVL
ncbi:MAG: EthD family reductase [Trueperaceae bacterium]|nr:EthD family reductase [Trueperaceae bacterium]